MKKVTVVGGGTGTYVVLSGLKGHDLDLGAIVTMMDSGGSTGKLRDQLEVLPPGDLRQSFVALSDAPDLWRKLFLYRFESGDLKGHNFGNIFLSALEKVSRDYDEVIKTTSYVLKTKGKVIPVTYEKTDIACEYENGSILEGEGLIDENNTETSRIKKAYLLKEVQPNKKAISRIEKSDFIIIGPGDLYTSIIPVLLVPGIQSAMVSTKAKIVYILNLMTKSGQTTGYSAADHIEDLTRYMGRSPDIVIVNSGVIPKNILKWYEADGELPVVNDLVENNSQKVIKKDIIDTSPVEKNIADEVTRSILRHSSDKLATAILDLLT